jgi:UDP-2,3-diacylglucosamine pyrophosphatase LpxH
VNYIRVILMKPLGRSSEGLFGEWRANHIGRLGVDDRCPTRLGCYPFPIELWPVGRDGMEGHNLLIVSDLHLGEGLDPQSGKLSRLEDFLFDAAFARFLRYHEKVRRQPRFGGRPWRLIINGDMFDFLQVVSLPEEGRLLRTVKGVGRRKELRINERDYGLGTTAEESEWKLKRIARGHQRFFAALGWFVAHGNHVVVAKGNHDVELHWVRVQERFVREVERAYTRERLALDHGPPITSEELGARMRFYPWFYYEPGRVYVEHGGQYEAANHFRDYLNPVVPGDPERIELPWGSLFVRYLFNKVEDVHPFADNIKPATRYLKWAFKKDPIRTIEVLVGRGWVFLRAFWNVARKTAASAFCSARRLDSPGQPGLVPLPPDVAEKIAGLAQQRIDTSWQEWVGSAVQVLLSLLMTLIAVIFVILAGLTFTGGPGWMTVVYLGAAVLAYFLRRGLKRSFDHLFEDDYLLRSARELERILKPAYSARYIVMGHDHRAALERLDQAWYVNTGAWVPVYEEEGPIGGREELTFFRLAWGYEGTPELLRWDDAAGAPARLAIQ